jgi:hypothetical protein
MPVMQHDQAGGADRSLKAALQLLKLFREVDPEMPMGAARAFLLIAAEENLSVADLQRQGDTALSSASRYHGYLGREDRHHRPGKGLVVALPSLEDSRKKALRLTPRGRLLASKVVDAVNKAKRASRTAS